MSQKHKFSPIGFWRENRAFIFFIILILASKSALGDWNTVPTASMKPSIIEGDRIFINKLAYDLKIPFINVSLIKFADPQRNDIIIFESEASKKRLVKRVIGIPGDQIALKNGQLEINGELASYQENTNQSLKDIILHHPEESVPQDLIESTSYFSHAVRFTPVDLPVPNNMSPITVPEGHYLALGDNRNLSADSRIIGFIPRDEIIGRSKKIIMSTNYDNYYLPRKYRFFIDID